MNERSGGDPKYASVADYWYHWQIVCCHLVETDQDLSLVENVHLQWKYIITLCGNVTCLQGPSVCL